MSNTDTPESLPPFAAASNPFHFLVRSVPLKAAGQVLHRGRSWLYDAVGSGLLDAVKNGANTEITVESIQRYQANMPRASIKPPKPPRLEDLDKLHAKQREERAKRRAARRRSRRTA
jgi:hypothetical protein